MESNMNISKELSDRIKKFVKKCSKNISEDKTVVKDFEDEMSVNLESSIVELIKEGHSEEEAFNIAIKRFGDANQIQNELIGIFKIEKKFEKVILMAAIVSLIVSLMTFTVHRIVHKDFSLIVPAEFEAAVNEKIKSGEDISSEEVNKLITKYKSKFRYVTLTKTAGNGELDTIYPEGFSIEEIKNDTEDFLSTYVRSPEGIEWTLRFGFNLDGFHLGVPILLRQIAVSTLAVYWVLFGVWSVIYAFHKKRLGFPWIIVFFTLNIVGYIIFELDYKMKLKLKTA